MGQAGAVKAIAGAAGGAAALPPRLDPSPGWAWRGGEPLALRSPSPADLKPKESTSPSPSRPSPPLSAPATAR